MSLHLPSRPSRPSGSSTVIGLGLVAALTLGACSTSGSATSTKAVAPASASGLGSEGGAVADASTGESAAVGSGVPASAGAGAGAAAKSGAAAPVAPVATADLGAGDKLVRTASLQVQVDDVEARAADVRRIAVAAGGSVVSENSSAVPTGAATGSVDKQSSRSLLSLAVPSDTLDRVLDDLGKLGTTVQRSSASRDVTTAYVDTQSRVKTMTNSLDQLRGLLAKATALDQVISLETEISRRQADLDSLQAQLNALDRKVSMSTLTVTLVTAAQVVAQEDDGSGFLGGLRHGWRAFLTTFGGVLTVLGAVLPFLVLLALVGTPVLVWWRRRRSAARLTGHGDVHGGNSGNSGNSGTGGTGGTGGNGGTDGRDGGDRGPDGGATGSEAPDGAEPAGERDPEPVGAR